MSRTIFTVHQLNDYVRILLARDPILKNVRVRGEVSNFKLHTSGHMYFSLKDEQARIQCVLFRQKRTGLGFLPRDGMQVIAAGAVSIYNRDGQYQLYVESLEQDGLGDLHLAFEELKKRLREEGLFDARFKKNLPLFPKKVAVITSHTGAAVQDIIHVIRQRNAHVDILILPVAVQGQGAAEQIARAIDYANTRNDIDLLIIGRGGGSLEELWAFNEEEVARAVFRSELPVISAVGHETDFTIADFVADLRAATPSNAAELAVPVTSSILSVIDGLKNKLMNTINGYLMGKQHKLNLIQNHYAFQMPRLLIDQQSQYADQLSQRIANAMQSALQSREDQLARAASSLEAMSPLKVLHRGYAIVSPEGMRTSIRSIQQLAPSQRVTVLFHDGQAVCRVEELQHE